VEKDLEGEGSKENQTFHVACVERQSTDVEGFAKNKCY
jgi:hypothetical protein